MIMGIGSSWALEGEAYKGSRQHREKEYEVSQSFGRQVLKLQHDSVAYYDAQGSIVEKQIRKANQTHQGFILYQRHPASHSVEKLEYNGMNQLQKRTVDISGENPWEKSRLIYDAKGRLIFKESQRRGQDDSEYWVLDYAQLGHLESYKQDKVDDEGRLSESIVYDYCDEIVEKHSYIYDAEQRLETIVVHDAEDALLYRKEFQYDAEGRLESENTFSTHDLPDIGSSYVYDAKGRLLQRSDFQYNPRFGGSLELKKQWDYSYK